MIAYTVTTSFEEDPSLSFTMTVQAPDEETAVRSVLQYLQLEFGIPKDARYSYQSH